ncbi:hypothetical protein BK126_26170 [Paenibacillus sp. FSL H7-0326]|nr:hypothetical protein BK126_26170 [Paenibacillus sp. FSL H7-0326]
MIAEIYFTNLNKNKEVHMDTSFYKKFKEECKRRNIKITCRSIGPYRRVVKKYNNKEHTVLHM